MTSAVLIDVAVQVVPRLNLQSKKTMTFVRALAMLAVALCCVKFAAAIEEVRPMHAVRVCNCTKLQQLKIAAPVLAEDS